MGCTLIWTLCIAPSTSALGAMPMILRILGAVCAHRLSGKLDLGVCELNLQIGARCET